MGPVPEPVTVPISPVTLPGAGGGAGLATAGLHSILGPSTEQDPRSPAAATPFDDDQDCPGCGSRRSKHSTQQLPPPVRAPAVARSRCPYWPQQLLVIERSILGSLDELGPP